MCISCATEVGPDRHLCPECASRKEYRCACGWKGTETKPWREIGICCPVCEGRLYPAAPVQQGLF